MFDLTDLTCSDVAGRVESIVTQSDTAQVQGSGDVPVLGTPRVVALAEAAAVSALTRRIPSHLTTVGVRIDLRHLKAVPLGREVSATAALLRREDDKLVFTVHVHDASDAVVAAGEIERVVVERAAFLAASESA